MSQKQIKLNLIEQKVSECIKCKDLAGTRNNTVFGVGNYDADIVLLGEAPGRDEDLQGEPFVGRAGTLLNNIIKSIGLSREDIYILNMIKCRPPNNRNPLPEEVKNCSKFLELQLKTIEPKCIVCLGAVAAQNLLQTEETISSLRKSNWHSYTVGSEKIKVLCTYHPAYLLRNPKAKKDVWDDLQLLTTEMISNE